MTKTKWILVIVTAFIVGTLSATTLIYAQPTFSFSFDAAVSGQNSVAVDSADRIIVGEGDISRIGIFDSSGNLVDDFGEFGTGEGEFVIIRGVAVDTQDNIVVADHDPNRVQVFDSFGSFLREFSFTAGAITGLATDSNDRIIISDTTNEEILVFDTNGNPQLTFSSPRPNGVATDSQDRIVVAGGFFDTISVYDSSGNLVLQFGPENSGNVPLSNPTGIGVDNFDNIVVPDEDNARIVVFDSEGNFLVEFGQQGSGDGEFDEPNGVTVDSQNRIIVQDTDNNRIQVFNPFSPSIEIQIDIKPGSDPNSVNCKPNKKGDINGVVPIGIFSSNSFDATTIDLNTFTLGNPTSELHGKLHIEDSNAVIHVSTADICAATSVQKGFEDVTLAGENAEGQFEGTDTVRIVKR